MATTTTEYLDMVERESDYDRQRESDKAIRYSRFNYRVAGHTWTFHVKPDGTYCRECSLTYVADFALSGWKSPETATEWGDRFMTLYREALDAYSA